MGSLLLAHVILPVSNERKLDFEVEYVHKEFHIAEQHLYREIQPGTIVYFRSVNAGRQWVIGLFLEQWQGGQLEEKWTASKAKWLPEERDLAGLQSAPRTWDDAEGEEHFENRAVLDTALDMSIGDLVNGPRPCPRWVGTRFTRP